MISFLSQTPASTTFLDQFDPRVRIIVFVFLASLAALCTQILPLFALLLLAMFFAYRGKLNVKQTFKKVIAMDLFILMLIIMLPFTTPAKSSEHVLFTVYGLTASFEGAHKALTIFLIANTVILLVLALIGPIPPYTLGQALLRLKVSNKLIQLMFFSVRYMDVIYSEYHRMRLAMKVRGFSAKTNWHTWRTFGYLVGMLLIRSLERSQRIHNAMLCRGFDAELLLIEKVDQNSLNWQRKDFVFLVLTIIFSTLIFLGELLL